MDKTRPIIVKKKGGHAGHHGGAWKVAYADFVRAMMSLFFIVLWLMSASRPSRGGRWIFQIFQWHSRQKGICRSWRRREFHSHQRQHVQAEEPAGAENS
jgi:hypothetical protein